MIPHPLSFRSRGRVAGQGSKNVSASGHTYEASKYLEAWRTKLTMDTKTAVRNTPSWDRTHAAVMVEILFTFERPKRHYRTGQFANVLRPDAPYYYPQTPDIDKACRAVLDALTQAEAIVDDRRVVKLNATQVYADTTTWNLAGAIILVTPIAVTGPGTWVP